MIDRHVPPHQAFFIEMGSLELFLAGVGLEPWSS
jgi:hypothetical protein